MNAPWSPQQHEWLQALGHDVLVLAAAGGGTEPVPPAASSTRAAVSVRGPVGNESGESPLLRAVLRAAGRRNAGELAAWLPDPASLRGNAAAKRALWPRLRALRRKPDA